MTVASGASALAQLANIANLLAYAAAAAIFIALVRFLLLIRRQAAADVYARMGRSPTQGARRRYLTRRAWQSAIYERLVTHVSRPARRRQEAAGLARRGVERVGEIQLHAYAKEVEAARRQAMSRIHAAGATTGEDRRIRLQETIDGMESEVAGSLHELIDRTPFGDMSAAEYEAFVTSVLPGVPREPRAVVIFEVPEHDPDRLAGEPDPYAVPHPHGQRREPGRDLE
jgi:hypothetical protein